MLLYFYIPLFFFMLICVPICLKCLLKRKQNQQQIQSLRVTQTIPKSAELVLTLSTLGKISSRQHFEIYIHVYIFFYFSQKTGFDISCKLSPMETICMKCLILFSGKNQKNITKLSSVEFAQRVVKVKSN